MTRNLALKQATAYARAEMAIAAIWRYDEPKSWTWADYESMDLYEACVKSIRYILPNGEVVRR